MWERMQACSLGQPYHWPAATAISEGLIEVSSRKILTAVCSCLILSATQKDTMYNTYRTVQYRPGPISRSTLRGPRGPLDLGDS
jgi:hypothetical protein